jgi:hypothetical protein
MKLYVHEFGFWKWSEPGHLTNISFVEKTHWRQCEVSLFSHRLDAEVHDFFLCPPVSGLHNRCSQALSSLGVLFLVTLPAGSGKKGCIPDLQDGTSGLVCDSWLAIADWAITIAVKIMDWSRKWRYHSASGKNFLSSTAIVILKCNIVYHPGSSSGTHQCSKMTSLYNEN